MKQAFHEILEGEQYLFYCIYEIVHGEMYMEM